MSKPLDALPGALRALGRGIEGSAVYATRATAEHYESVLEDEGNRHYITSPRGQKVPLDRVDVRQERGGVVPEFAVRPVARALGLWVIVEQGSKPHAILPKGMSRKVKRLTGALNAGRRLTRGQANLAASLVTGVGLFAGVKPLGVTNVGPRYVVQHPGHEPLGTPWKDGVQRADRDSERVFDEAVFRFVVDKIGG